MPAAKRVWTQAQDEAIHYRRNTMKESWAAIRDDPIWGDTPPSAKSLKTHYDMLEINHATSQLQSTIDAAQEKYYHGIDSSQNKTIGSIETFHTLQNEIVQNVEKHALSEVQIQFQGDVAKIQKHINSPRKIDAIRWAVSEASRHLEGLYDQK